MLVVIAYPIYYTIELSFFKTPPNLQMKDKIFVGLDNYVTILTSESFHQVTIKTLIWTIVSTFFAFLLGLGAALALHREFAGRGLLRAILLIPYVVSAVAASYVWKWLYHSDFGVIGALVGPARPDRRADQLPRQHPDRAAVADRRQRLAGVLLRHGHADGRACRRCPSSCCAPPRSTAPTPGSASGTSPCRTCKGVSMVTILLLMVANFNSFIIPWIMTGGGPAGASDIWITHIYNIAFGRQRYGLASAYAVILFIVMMMLGYFYVKALTRGDEGARAWLSARSRARRVDWWRWAGRAVIVAPPRSSPSCRWSGWC